MGDLIEVIRTITIRIEDRHMLWGQIRPEITIIDETQIPVEDPPNRTYRFPTSDDRLNVIDGILNGINRTIKRSDAEHIPFREQE